MLGLIWDLPKDITNQNLIKRKLSILPVSMICSMNKACYTIYEMNGRCNIHVIVTKILREIRVVRDKALKDLYGHIVFIKACVPTNLKSSTKCLYLPCNTHGNHSMLNQGHINNVDQFQQRRNKHLLNMLILCRWNVLSMMYDYSN